MLFVLIKKIHLDLDYWKEINDVHFIGVFSTMNKAKEILETMLHEDKDNVERVEIEIKHVSEEMKDGVYTKTLYYDYGEDYTAYIITPIELDKPYV